ncbi:MAG: PIN domain-containing protein [Usitatibacter sp.]
MRVFLDANVLFSAAYRETGSVRAFFALADAGACELVSSGYAIEEARRNILAKHPERINDLEALLGRITPCLEPAPATLAWAASQRLPPKDAPILAAAVDAHCHLLVTGDRTHFGALFGRRLRGTVVLLPVDAIGLLVGG